jgi:hypothetical protein
VRDESPSPSFSWHYIYRQRQFTSDLLTREDFTGYYTTFYWASLRGNLPQFHFSDRSSDSNTANNQTESSVSFSIPMSFLFFSQESVGSWTDASFLFSLQLNTFSVHIPSAKDLSIGVLSTAGTFLFLYVFFSFFFFLFSILFSFLVFYTLDYLFY